MSANTCLPSEYDKYAFPPNFSPDNAASPGTSSPNNLGEQFWNCAEMELLAKNPSALVRTLLAPVASPTMYTVTSPTTAPVTSPTMSPVANLTTAPLAHPVPSPSEAPVSSPVASPTPQGEWGGWGAYAERHFYAALELSSYDGMNYECKPAPYTGWCSGDA
jgi:hypothetical protein